MACGCGSSTCSTSNCTNCNGPELCTAVYVQDSWNIPACDAIAVVNVPKLKTIIIGGYFWNPNFGYFKVTSFNALIGQVTLLNECTSGNADPGTIVPACTQFAIAPLPLSTDCPVLRGCISVADTSSVDMTYDSGTGIISGVSKISLDANNTLSIHADGLYGSPATLGNFIQGPAPSVASLGAELVTNGAFTTNLAGWTVVPGDWIWSAGTALHVAGNTTSMSQSVNVTAGKRYLITYTIAGPMAGTFAMFVGGVLVTNFNTVETDVAGTWYGSFVAGATGSVLFQITPDITFNSSFDDISIKETVPVAVQAFDIADSTGASYFRVRGYGSQSNIYLGDGGIHSVSGQFNVGLGRGALENNINGDSNVAVGVRALNLHAVGGSNVAVGHEALAFDSSGINNTAVGYQALNQNIGGFYNTAVGYGAMTSNTQGFSNVAIGVNALFSNVTGNYSIAIGSNALSDSTLGQNIAIGIDCSPDITTGVYNLAIGQYALFKSTIARDNVALGIQSLYENTDGVDNVAVGTQSLTNSVSAKQNTAIGRLALNYHTAGDDNTVVGFQAGVTDVLANRDLTGSQNTWVGSNAGPGSAAVYTNTVAVGYLAKPIASNQAVLGNASVTTTLLRGLVGIGVTVPTAEIHLAAGTATAGTAPIKFTTGTNLTAPEAGTMEYSTGRLLFTDTDATRRHIMQAVNATKTVAGAPYVNDGYVTVVINGTTLKLMTTA